MTVSENKSSKFKSSISLKLIIVVSLSLLLLIPSLMIRKLIDEREYRKDDTIREITAKWGADQLITGPILLVPYEKTTHYTDGTQKSTLNYFQILPDELKITGDLQTDIRHRGIYDVLIYTGEFNISGNFNSEDFANWPDKYDNLLWDDAKLIVGISDTKGISKLVNLNWNKETHKFSPGILNCNLAKNGIHSDVLVNTQSNNTFSIDITLNGSGSAYFSPVGKNTQVTLSSDWSTPSFDGDYITTENQVSDSGFTAQWNTNEMNRIFPQIITNDGYISDEDNPNFGVELLLPVDTYQKSERSVKYSFLFISLTFLIIFFAEITGKHRVHPVQYLIIGLALVIFYSLLIALAEHLAFNIAYLVSSIVIISMIIIYTQALFKKLKNTLIVGTLLILLYIYLFTILQIADYALILGNIGLVLILALVMIYSRKVNWYGDQNLANTDD